MKPLALIILTLGLSAQEKIPSDVKHFYSSVALCEVTYHTQRLLLPKQKEHNRFLITIGTVLTLGVTKEVWDMRKKNPTGFSKDDLFMDSWGILCWVPFRICLNDWKKRNDYSFENKNLLLD